MKRPVSVNLLEKLLPTSTPARCASTADPFLDMSQYYMLMFISTASNPTLLLRWGKVSAGMERESEKAFQGFAHIHMKIHSLFVKGDVLMKCISTLKLI